MVKNVNVIDSSELVNKVDFNAKIKDIKDKVPSITNLVTTAALTGVKDKIPNVSDLAKKADFVEKVKEIESKYFTTLYDKFTNNILDQKIKNKELVHKSDISKFINKSDLDKKIGNKCRIKSTVR